MKFDIDLKSYIIYLRLERAMSENTVESYKRDIDGFLSYADEVKERKSIKDISSEDISDYLKHINNELSERSQARLLSALRSFFKYLIIENKIENSPAELIDLPKIGIYLPDVLSINEVTDILNSIDLSKPNGQRNRAIIEVLYGCGLRVSELVNLKISDIFRKEKFIRIIGKGNKERLVPLGKIAEKQLYIYIEEIRVHATPHKDYTDIVFLNNRGKNLTREMIFLIIKKIVKEAGINKNVSPHTFRHSFATHMIQNGADIRMVQDMLGHESILTTEIYTHIDREQLKTVIDKYHPLSGF